MAEMTSVLKVGVDGTGAKKGAAEVVVSLKSIRAEYEALSRAQRAFGQGKIGVPGGGASAAAAAATRNPAADAARAATAAARAAQKAADDATRSENVRARALETALTRRQGLEQRIARQLGENAELTSRLDQATAKYAEQLRSLTPGTTAWIRAQGDFRRETQAVSGEIARQGGLLRVLNTNADRTINAIGKGSKLAAWEVKNLGFQLNDIGVSLASGQSPLMVLIQQGAQIGQIFQGKGLGVTGVLKEIGLLALRLVNPVTAAIALVVGLGVALGSLTGRGGEIQRTADLLGLTAEKTQVLQKTLDTMSRGQMGFGTFADEAKKFALALDDAARNPTSQLARLFTANNKSLTDSNGKLKSQADLWKISIGLIRGAGNEVQGIKVGDILGLQEDFTREIYRSQKGFDDVQSSVIQTGTALDNETVKKAAEFEKAWKTGWENFKRNAGDAITSVEAGMFDFLQKLSTNDTFKAFTKAITTGIGSGGSGDPSGIPAGAGALLAAGFRGPLNVRPSDPWNPRTKDDSAIGLTGKPRLVASVASAVASAAVPLALTPDSRAVLSNPAALLGLPGTGSGGIENRPDTPANDAVPTGGRGPTTVIPGNNPPKADAVGDRFRDEVADLRAKIDAQNALNAAYGQGAAAIAAAQREQQIANENAKISAKYTADQRGQVERLNVALIDAKRNGVGAETLAGLQAQNELIRDEIGLVSKSAAEREKELAIIRAKRDLVAAGVDPASPTGTAVVGAVSTGKDLEENLARAERIKAKFDTTFDGIADSITDAFMKGGDAAIDFEKIVTDVIGDIMKELVKATITDPLKNFAMEMLGPILNIGGKDPGVGGILGSLGGLFGGLFGGGGGVTPDATSFIGTGGLYHTGGIAGAASSSRVVSLDAYRDARRYHTGGMAGFAPDEVPAILRRGEEVLTREDSRHRWNQGGSNDNKPTSVTNRYTIVNNGEPVQVEETGRQQNESGGEDITITLDRIVAQKLRKRGTDSNKALRQGFGAEQRLRGR
jgi:hypothetical protein